MSDIHGLVTGVREEKLGDALSVAVPALVTTVLHVYDVADFDEDGGTLSLDGVLYDYDTVDDDASTITLTVGTGGAAVAVDTEVYVYDAANSQVATRYLASVDSIDGFDGDPVEAVVDQCLAHALATSMRDGTGESVTLVRDGSELQVAKIHGRMNALASLQFMQGGLTTRQSDVDGGVDIRGTDSGNPGVFVFDSSGNQLAQMTPDGFATDNPGAPRIVINNTTDPAFNQGGLIGFYVTDGTWIPGSLAAEWTPGPPATGTLSLVGPVNISGSTAAAVSLSYLSGTGSILNIDAHSIGIGASATSDITLLRTTTVTAALHSTMGGLFMDDLAGGGTVGASINNNGRIIVTPSSRRFKSNVKPLSLEAARKVLDLEPVTFTLKEEAGTESRRTYPGFIAEQAADVGCDLWVNRDSDGEPNGFRYAELTAPLVTIIRDQQKQIDDLTARLERLEAKGA